MAGRRLLVGFALALALAGTTLWACGGSDGDRETRTCGSCNAGVDQGCLDECRDFCLAGDPDCESRCSAQCDECRRDLVCRECRAGCTGTTLRCAPQNEVVTCADGEYGGTVRGADHSRR